MAALRKISEEELREILAAHKLWLGTEGKQGRHADLSKCDLQGADLQGADLQSAYFEDSNLKEADLWSANLEGANLQNADLQQTDLRHANLQGANLRTANLCNSNLQGANLQNTDLWGAKLSHSNVREANLQGAYLYKAMLDKANFFEANINESTFNLEQFFDIEPSKLPEAIRLEIQLKEIRQQIQSAKANKELNKIEELKQSYANTTSQLEKLEEQNQLYQAQIHTLEEQLKDRIGLAKESLETSLKTTKERIEHNTAEAKQISRISQKIFAFTLFLLIAVPFALHGMPPSETIKQLGTFAALLYTLPVVATLLIGTTLLRHHKKLQDEIRHFSDQQQRIELYSGLLEASQHAAAAFHKENNNRAAEELVEETFKAIRSRLLSEQAAAAERSQESDEDPPLLNKLTDIVGKLTEAAAKSGKDDKN